MNFPKLTAVLLVGLLLVQAASQQARAGGLNQAEPIGAYLDGKLPPQTPRSASGSWKLVNAFPTLNLSDPVQMVPVPRSNQLLVAEQPGRLVAFENDPSNATRNQLVDFKDQVQSLGDSGLLGVTIHPDFGKAGSPNREYVYVYYRYSPDNSELHKAYLRLSRFSWAGGNAKIDPASEYVLINQYDRSNWHNGGGMFFGVDGFLYLGIGDEGGANDGFNVTQKRDGGLFAGIMRIDVDRDSSRSHPVLRQPIQGDTPPVGWPATYSQGYYIPNDNPWPSPDGSQLEEYWALGARSPHRMSMDPVTGRIWLGDVGQGAREEISLVSKGGNLQWPYREGDTVGPKPKPTNLLGVDTPPVYAYGRGVGGCIIGGHVYRGTKNPDLVGRYIFGDLNNGVIRSMTYIPGQAPVFEELGEVEDRRLVSFGMDSDGEVYAIILGFTGSTGGIIYRFERSGITVPEPPSTLSATGAFSNIANLTPRSGLMPYDLVQPLWSDGADKKRWIAIPNDGNPNSASEKIGFSENGAWDFPIGTVMVKHFEFAGRRLETRFFVNGSDGKQYGFTYKWRPDNSDADLLPGPPVDETISLAGGQSLEWHFPGRNECFICHTDASGVVLGPKTRHLNRDLFYPKTGRTDNQLKTLNDLGFLSPALNNADIPGFLTSANINDPSESLERRARAYLDINCAQCHQPGGPTQATFDARLTSPANFQNMINVDPSNSLGLTSPKIIRPKNVPNSILHLRMSSLEGCCAMPPLAKNAVDTNALGVLAEWINSLDPAISPTGPTGAAPPADYSIPILSLTIRGGGSTVSGPFIVDVNASEAIRGLTASDFDAANATIKNVSGSGATWTVSVTPDAIGAGSIALAADRVTDNSGNANRAIGAPLTFNNDGTGGGGGTGGAVTNLLTNGGFESGLQQWDSGGSAGVSSNARTGGSAARVGAGSFVVQSIPVIPSGKYIYTGFYIADASLSRLEAGATFWDANGNEILDKFALLSPTTTYSPFSLEVQAPANAASVSIYILSSSGGNATVDDLVFGEEGDTGGGGTGGGTGGGPEPVNILTNGGFESGGFAPWDIGNSGTTLSADARTGNSAAFLNRASFLVHNISALSGQEFRLSGHYKTSGPGGIFEAGIIFWGAGPQILAESETSFVHSSSYAPFSVSGIAPPNTVSISAWIYNGAPQTMTIDDVILEDVAVSSPNSGAGNKNFAVDVAGAEMVKILSSRDPWSYLNEGKNPVQPDLTIKSGKRDFIGDNVYESSGSRQVARALSKTWILKGKFSIRWENDAVVRYDSAAIQYTGRSKGFKIRYFELGGGLENITALVKTGQYETPLSAPGEGASYLMRVRQGRTSRAAKFNATFSAVSMLEPSSRDTVRMQVKRSR